VKPVLCGTPQLEHLARHPPYADPRAGSSPAPGASVYTVYHRRDLAADQGEQASVVKRSCYRPGRWLISHIDVAAEGGYPSESAAITACAKIRGEMKISMAKRIDIILQNASAEDLRRPQLHFNAPLLNKPS
jgi:hypothetical protein